MSVIFSFLFNLSHNQMHIAKCKGTWLQLQTIICRSVSVKVVNNSIWRWTTSPSLRSPMALASPHPQTTSHGKVSTIPIILIWLLICVWRGWWRSDRSGHQCNHQYKYDHEGHTIMMITMNNAYVMITMTRPGKRPMSSMSPTIITDSRGAAKLVIGAHLWIMIMLVVDER